jgi:hypothetical protein
MLKSSIIILGEFENIFCDKMKIHYGEPLYLITLYYFFLNGVHWVKSEFHNVFASYDKAFFYIKIVLILLNFFNVLR